METYSFSAGKLTLLKSNVLLIEFEELKPISVRNMYDLTELIKKLVGPNNYHTITEFRKGLFNLTPDAKKFIADQNRNTKNRLSDSILIDSLAKRIEVEIYLTFNKPTIKTKVFHDLNKALNWIESVEKKNLAMV